MRRILVFAFVLFAALVQIANSQTTFASITGTVSDPAGALVPNATIVATNIETNIQSTAKSNEAGVFTIAQLKEGKYNVRAEAAGFKGFTIENVRSGRARCPPRGYHAANRRCDRQGSR